MGQKHASYTVEADYLRSRSVDSEDCDVANWSPQQRERLRRLMRGDVSKKIEHQDHILTDEGLDDTFDNVFSRFLDMHPIWKRRDRVTLFFDAFLDIPYLKIMRRQKAGLCFMHAPVVLQHYLVSIYKGASSDLKTIDLVAYVRMSLKGNEFIRYLRQEGGSSINFLDEINYHVPRFRTCTLAIPDRESVSFQPVCEDIMTRLQTRPALVSNFAVEESFRLRGTSFKGVLQSNIVGFHAMVLIGGRLCDEHGFVFLLQNWWDERYFIEVSASYMASAKATISFVECAVKDIPDDFPVVYCQFAG